MKARNFKLTLFAFLAVLFVFSSCRKNFDEPPISELPNLQATITIADLKDSLGATQAYGFKAESTVVGGVVVGDDRSGNFYKEIVFQDSTGGISISIDAYDLYNEFPVGRYVFVRLKDLYVVQDGDVVIIGATNDPSTSRLPQSTYRNFVIGGESGKTVTPAARSLSTLTANDYYTLVTLDSMEFTAQYAGQTYADVVAQQSTNAELHECTSGSTVILRNSAFSDFAGDLTPTGNGSVTAVYSSFNGDRQLFIRDPSDLDMDGDRCTFLPGANATEISIDSIRLLYLGVPTIAPTERKIKGIVISDKDNGNFQTQNAVVQEPNGSGIIVRFTNDHTFAMGDEIEIDVTGQEISEFNGGLQLNSVPNSYATFLSSGNSITPRVATVQQISTNAEDWESTLVQVYTASLTGNSTYSGSLTINDGTNTMDLFTDFGASFAGASVPSDTGDVTAIVGEYNGYQLKIRNLNDVNIAGGGGGGGSCGGGAVDTLYEDFSAGSDDADINFTCWTNDATAGSRLWRCKEFSGNKYAQGTAYQSSDATNEYWLITPEINCGVNKFLAFESAKAFWTHDALSVWVSTDYDGSNVSAATWTQITSATLAQNSDSDNTFIPSGNVDLSSYTGQTIYIGFKYTGAAPNSQTGTYRVDNIHVFDQ